MKAHARRPVSASAARVLSSATLVAESKPWARYSDAKAMLDAPTMATSTGFEPSSKAGSTNTTRTATLRARPAKAPTPRQRPSAITVTTNNTTSTHIALDRS